MTYPSMQDCGLRYTYGDKGATVLAVLPIMTELRAHPSRLKATPYVSHHDHARPSEQRGHAGSLANMHFTQPPALCCSAKADR